MTATESSPIDWMNKRKSQWRRDSWAHFGGEQGVAFTLNNSGGVVEHREDASPRLDAAKRHALGKGQWGAIYLQPKGKP